MVARQKGPKKQPATKSYFWDLHEALARIPADQADKNRAQTLAASIPKVGIGGSRGGLSGWDVINIDDDDR